MTLDLAEPEMLFPVNAPPAGRTAEIPPGRSLEIKGEENHLDVLTPLIASGGAAGVWVSLHEITDQRPRSAGQVVEVRLDGKRVGQLLPKMSAEYLPVIRHADARGVLLYARAAVRGNALAAQVKVYPARSAELPAEWIKALDTIAGTAQETQERAAAAAPSPPPPPPGWYPDPSGPGTRWWDGSAWTHHVNGTTR